MTLYFERREVFRKFLIKWSHKKLKLKFGRILGVDDELMIFDVKFVPDLSSYFERVDELGSLGLFKCYMK